jgi:hypothetical protein
MIRAAAAKYLRTGRPEDVIVSTEAKGPAHTREGTLAHALKLYMADCRKHQARKTVEIYEATLQRFVSHAGDSIGVADAFTREKLAAFEKHREDQLKKSKRARPGNRALNLDRQTISAFASWLVEQGVLGDNPRPDPLEAPERDPGPPGDTPTGPNRKAPQGRRRADGPDRGRGARHDGAVPSPSSLRQASALTSCSTCSGPTSSSRASPTRRRFV